MSAALATNAIPITEVRLGGRVFPTQGQYVIDCIEAVCVFTKAKWRGKPFLLLGWEKRLIFELFEVDPVTLRRRYRWAYIEIPKKQGKTELIAAILVYMLIFDSEESPEIACAANSDEQADLVYGACKAMCEISPDLAALTTCYTKEIELKENPAAKIKRYSATVGANDGQNLSTIGLDELHEFKGEKGEGVYNVLTNGTGAREQPLVLMITTAGYDKNTVCGRMHDHAEKLLKGEIEDETFFARLYRADEKLNLDDPAQFEQAIRQANPSLGHTVDLDFYRDQFKRKTRAVFGRYFLGWWSRGLETWLKPGQWEACRVARVEFVGDAPIYLGLDGSTARDSTALVAGQWQAEKLAIKSWIWQRPVSPHTGEPDPEWRLPFAEVEEVIRELHATGDLTAVPYDPALVTWMAQSLEAEGIPMIEMPQTNNRMMAPTQALYELITERRLMHAGDPAMDRQMSEVVVRQVSSGGRGGQRIVKTPDRLYNDGPIALVMMVAEAGKPADEAEAEPEIIVIDGGL